MLKNCMIFSHDFHPIALNMNSKISLLIDEESADENDDSMNTEPEKGMSRHTLRLNKKARTVFGKYLTSVGEKRDMLDFDIETLDSHLANFWFSLRHVQYTPSQKYSKGTETRHYMPTTIKQLHHSLKRYFQVCCIKLLLIHIQLIIFCCI